MNPEFYNTYVDKCLSETIELTKVKIMMSAQIAYYEKQIATLKGENEQLQKDLDKALNKATSKKKAEAESEF